MGIEVNNIFIKFLLKTMPEDTFDQVLHISQKQRQTGTGRDRHVHTGANRERLDRQEQTGTDRLTGLTVNRRDGQGKAGTDMCFTFSP